jgi:peptide deformylase|tara:strand:+ start:128 stop:676 length:549 start_codon:yes stop_codon:yes gene_type:complete
MAVREIVKYGDLILRKQCRDVEDIFSVSTLVEDMFDTMYEEDGIGLAANQIGEDLNLFVIDISHKDEAEKPRVFINSKIIDKKGECLSVEGCLSIPGIQVELKRSEFITLQYYSLEGEQKKREFNDLMARAIQHEMDHLNGIFIVDRISDLVKMQYKKDLKEIEEDALKESKVREKIQGIVL